MKAGYLYIVTNDAFPGFVKVGCTENLNSRLRAYQTSDLTEDIKWFIILNNDCFAVRKAY